MDFLNHQREFHSENHEFRKKTQFYRKAGNEQVFIYVKCITIHNAMNFSVYLFTSLAELFYDVGCMSFENFKLLEIIELKINADCNSWWKQVYDLQPHFY